MSPRAGLCFSSIRDGYWPMAGWLNSIKDTALAATVRSFLGPHLEGYGKIEQLKMDTKSRQIELKLRLEGEELPVDVILKGYEICEKEGATYISSPDQAFTSSRTWLTKLLNTHLAGRDFVIPEKYAKYARGLVG